LLGYFEYGITAVYYFGESGASNSIIITGISESTSEGIEIYPVPANDFIYIKSPIIIEKLEVYSNIGIRVISDHNTSKTYQLFVSHLSPGIYFIKIETEQDLILRKIVVQ